MPVQMNQHEVIMKLPEGVSMDQAMAQIKKNLPGMQLVKQTMVPGQPGPIEEANDGPQLLLD